MSLRQKILMLVAGLALVFPHASRADDFDVEVEESMAESDATSAKARSERSRLAKEEMEAERSKKEASKVKAAADLRHKQTEAEIVTLEKDIKTARAEQVQAAKEKAAAEKLMAKDEARLKEGMAFLAKIRGENQALRHLIDEQHKKIAGLEIKTREAQDSSLEQKAALEAGKKEFEKGKLDLKAAQARLVGADADAARKKAEYAKQLDQLKVQHKANKDKTAETEKVIMGKRRDLSKKEEEVKAAESEVRAGEGRMKDAEERLRELSTKAQSKEGELQRREQKAVRNLESREAKEALIAVKNAQAGQTLAATRTMKGEENMNVELRSPASAKMVMTKDCGVFEKPNANSKVLGTKKAGTAMTGHASGNWVGYSIKGGRTVYVMKSCF